MKTTNRIIINSYGVTDEESILVVKEVIDMGKISDDNRVYCYATVFNAKKGREVSVECKNKGNTNTFYVKYYE